MFNYDNPYGIDYVKTIPSVGCRVLSIAFHPVENKLFYGCIDGTIRCVDEVCIVVYFHIFIAYIICVMYV